VCGVVLRWCPALHSMFVIVALRRSVMPHTLTYVYRFYLTHDNARYRVRRCAARRHRVKLEFHGTDTDTDIRARIVARMSACPATSPLACHEPETHDDPRRLVRRLVRHSLFLVRILARMSVRETVRDACVYTCKHVLYTISYLVHVYKITR